VSLVTGVKINAEQQGFTVKAEIMGMNATKLISGFG
jgi:hypothetical protein